MSAGVACPAGAKTQAAGAAAKPNILVILTDDQGRGDYSAFGTPDIHTPHIDRLFHEGITFRNFFANSCVCSPSDCAGKYSAEAKCRGSRRPSLDLEDAAPLKKELTH